MSELSVFDSIKHVTGSRYNRITYNKDILDDYILRLARDRGVRLPSTVDPERINYFGAHVFIPTAGLSDHVFYIDLASLYPNSMRAINISPDTLIGTEDDFEQSPYTEDDVVWSYIDTRPVKWLDDGESWTRYTDGEYKMVYDPEAPKVRWADDPQMEKCYYVHPDVQTGLVTEGVERLINLKYQFEGSLYSAIKRVVNCFTPDTDVLTPDGIVNIRELEVGDEVYSYDTENECVEVKAVTETFAYPDYDGEIHHFQNQNVDLAVTDNHKMVAQNANPHNTDDSFSFIEAGEMSDGTSYKLPHDWDMEHGDSLESFDLTDHLDEYEVFVDTSVHGHTFAAELGFYPKRRKNEHCGSGYVLDHETYERHREYIDSVTERAWVHVSNKQKWVPKQYDGDDALELFAWFITEGSSYTSSPKQYEDSNRGVTHSFTISQHKVTTHDRITSLLDRMGLNYYDGERDVTVASEAWKRVLEQFCGDNSHDKCLPQFVFDLSHRQKVELLDVLMLGDGDSKDTSYRYTTSSGQLRDDVMRLLVHLGRTPKYAEDSGSYRIYTGKTQNSLRPKKDRQVSSASDGVYCVEVADNHTLLAGRNGKFQFCGNSVYGYISYATQYNASRVYDWRLGESVTLAGRKIIKFTARTAVERLRNRGYPDAAIVIGDTDGAGISLPSADSWEDCLDDVTAVAQYINEEAYPRFMHDEFGVDRDAHYMEVEPESYARRLFVPSENPSDPNSDGSKKRYAQWMQLEDTSVETADVVANGFGFEKIDEVSMTGIEAVRSDTADATTELQTFVLERLVRDGVDARSAIFERLREAYTDAHSGAVDPQWLARRKGMSSDPSEYGSASRTPQPAYRGAKWANEMLDVELRGGDKPKYYAVDDVGSYRSTYRAKTAEDGDMVDWVSLPQDHDVPDELTIDYQTMTEKAIEAPLKPIIETMGWQWHDIESGTVDSQLSAYM